MKSSNLLLRISVCLAMGGLVTIVVICFLIGFGLHHIVGKYALYTALFLQSQSLIVNRIVDRRYDKACDSYKPSKRMGYYRLVSEILWSVGLVCQCGVINVTHELTVSRSINTYVDNNSPRLDHTTLYKLRLSNSYYEHVCTAYFRLKIIRT